MVTWGGVTTLGPNSTSTPPRTDAPKTPTPNIPPTPTNTAGAGSTPGGFGAFNFGTSQANNKTSTPVAKSLFGTPTAAAPSGGLFGTTTNAAPVPATGSLFGNTTAAPATTSGIFGNKAAAPNTTSLFGNTAARSTALATGTSVFGASMPATSFQSTNMGNTSISSMTQPQLQVISETGGNLESSLRKLRAYDPVASAFHHTPSVFQTIFYDPGNTPPNPPQNVDIAKWSQAVALNPDPNQLTPVQTAGAESLLVRINQQQLKAKSLKSIVSQLHDTIHKDIKPRLADSQLSARHCQTERRALERRLMYVMRKVELLRCMNLPIQEGETQAKSRLDTLSKTLANINHLVNEIHQFSSDQAKLTSSYTQEQQHEWTEDEKSKVYMVLKVQQNGLESLSKIIKRDVRDMDIAKKQMKEFESKIGLPRNF